MTENEKIKLVRNHFSLTMDAFGERVGLKKSAISLMEGGRSAVSNSLRRAVCREFKISEAWLRGEIDGDEIIFEESPIDDAARFAAEHNLGDIEAILIREYLNLTDKDRDVFRKYLKNVLKGLGGIQTAAAPDVADTDVGNTTAADQTDTTAADRDSAGINAGNLAAEQESEDMTIDAMVASYRAELEAARKEADSASRMPTEREA